MAVFTPFSVEIETQVSSISESELIFRIRSWLGSACPRFPEGIGDDCAVSALDPTDKYLLTTVDGVGWGKHFDERVPPQFVGRKLLARNLSDIASMGGAPTRAVVSLWMAPDISLRWLQLFYEGMASLAQEYNVDIVGGDVSSAPAGVFIADLCLQGVSNHPILRKQVSKGDSLWVTGELGGSIKEKHFSFTPRLEEGQWLADTQWAKSMMDVSDGLAKDLPALVGHAVVELGELPVSDAAICQASADGVSISAHAMNDGEDYELLFAVDASKNISQFVREWTQRFETKITHIGHLVTNSDQGAFSARNEVGETLVMGSGYEHF